MRVMVMVKATNESEAGKLPTREQFEAMGRFNEALVKAGVILAADGLHPSAKGKRVRFSGSARSVIDGPFAQTGELVAGFWLWKVASMDEAVEWVKRCPNPMESDSEIERCGSARSRRPRPPYVRWSPSRCRARSTRCAR